ncbi:acetyltransferase [Actibacterium mucosum KCTC 23349]|uniref:Acetyltransferase n=1 Tax=Actibacterium mucosum KCTC 23349 TaxID=1454373 RepID=A0A037ZM39_9RHOB|nr:GNAT family N-acetyltransferase [Actibacterium mucosum]KAJ56612.1 acetyltransferase [Actibacterium mucosum KCTC 23349]
MSLIRLATVDDIPRLAPLVAAFHDHHQIEQSDDDRIAVLTQMLSDDIHAAIWLIGPPRAPVGYIAVAFGFSIELGGRDAFIDEFFIRPAVRGRGMGSQTLMALLPMLAQMGVKAIHMEVERANDAAKRLYTRMGFNARDTYHLMTRILA